MKRRKKQKNFFFSKVGLLIYREQFTGFSSNLQCGFPEEEGTSIANLVPFRYGIPELNMYEITTL